MREPRTPEQRKYDLENPEFVYVNIHCVWTDKRDEKEGSMLEGGFILDWAAKRIGFGQMTFKQTGPDLRNLKIDCESEHMGIEFVKKALAFFAASVKVVE